MRCNSEVFAFVLFLILFAKVAREVLKVKNVAVVDEIGAAAELFIGQAKESMPVVIMRGLGGSYMSR